MTKFNEIYLQQQSKSINQPKGEGGGVPSDPSLFSCYLSDVIPGRHPQPAWPNSPSQPWWGHAGKSQHLMLSYASVIFFLDGVTTVVSVKCPSMLKINLLSLYQGRLVVSSRTCFFSFIFLSIPSSTPTPSCSNTNQKKET